jgi:hypothetical protein
MVGALQIQTLYEIYNCLYQSHFNLVPVDGINEEPAWKLTQKVALTHNSVKNNECDVTYVLKEPWRRSKCIIHKA